MATYRLSPAQSQAWHEGGWLSLEIQETVLEDIERQHLDGVVIVVLADGAVAFWVSEKGVVI